MNNYKIIQIIPAPETMRVIYKGCPDYHQKVLAIALVEDESGDRTLKPMDCSYSGDIDFIEDDLSFKGFIYTDIEE